MVMINAQRYFDNTNDPRRVTITSELASVDADSEEEHSDDERVAKEMSQPVKEVNLLDLDHEPEQSTTVTPLNNSSGDIFTLMSTPSIAPTQPTRPSVPQHSTLPPATGQIPPPSIQQPPYPSPPAGAPYNPHPQPTYSPSPPGPRISSHPGSPPLMHTHVTQAQYSHPYPHPTQYAQQFVVMPASQYAHPPVSSQPAMIVGAQQSQPWHGIQQPLLSNIPMSIPGSHAPSMAPHSQPSVPSIPYPNTIHHIPLSSQQPTETLSFHPQQLPITPPAHRVSMDSSLPAEETGVSMRSDGVSSQVVSVSKHSAASTAEESSGNTAPVNHSEGSQPSIPLPCTEEGFSAPIVETDTAVHTAVVSAEKSLQGQQGAKQGQLEDMLLKSVSSLKLDSSDSIAKASNDSKEDLQSTNPTTEQPPVPVRPPVPMPNMVKTHVPAMSTYSDPYAEISVPSYGGNPHPHSGFAPVMINPPPPSYMAAPSPAFAYINNSSNSAPQVYAQMHYSAPVPYAGYPDPDLASLPPPPPPPPLVDDNLGPPPPVPPSPPEY